MHVVNEDQAGPGGQRARFQPLKMVARALSAWQGAAVSGESAAPQPVAAPEPIMTAFGAQADEPAAAASGESLLAIVNALLASDDEMSLEPDDADFDLVTLVRDALDAFGPDARAQGVTLALAVAPGAAGIYQGDVLRLRHMLLNLVAGALKATTEDTLVFTAAWEAGAVILHLAGIEATAVMSRLLADKQRPGPRRPAAYRLATAQTTAQALGGAVRTRAADGLEVSVPLRRLADARTVARREASAAVAPAPPTSLFAPGLRVLVAEEDPAHRQALSALLAGMGLQGVVVSDGQEMVAAWRQESWDALIIDIEGEAICGASVARSIRSAEAVARWPRTPILAVAANLKLRDLDEDFAELIDGLVAKPIQAARLEAAISSALGVGTAATTASTIIPRSAAG
jgi:CheY-like chemotaxis protein